MSKFKIDIEDAVLVDNKLWFCLTDYKSLVSMDVETKEKKSYRIPMEGSYIQTYAFRAIKSMGRKLYLVPFFEQSIIQFDIDTEEFLIIEIDGEKKGLTGFTLFLGVAEYQNYLFLLGAHSQVVVRLNTIDNHIDYITDWKKNVERMIFDSSDLFFCKQSVVNKNKLFVPFCNANAVLEIDCISMETMVHCLGAEKQGYAGICYSEDCLWLAPRRGGTLVKWNLITEQITEIRVLVPEHPINSFSYIGIVVSGTKKILYPNASMEDYLWREDIETQEGAYLFGREDGNQITTYERKTKIFTVINKVTSEKNVVKVELDENDIDREACKKDLSNIIIENERIGVQQMLSFLK